MIKCPNCEGEMNFEPGVQEVVCQYCGTKFNPNTLNEEVKFSKEVEGITGKAYTCTQCGANLLSFDETAITFCSYCGSQAMIESRMMQINKPDFIIPFKVTREECMKEYKEKVKNKFFVPHYLKDDVTIEKFRGIYIPYSIYSYEYKGDIEEDGKKYDHRSGNYEIYKKYKITSTVDATFEGMQKDLRSNFYDKFSENLPFDLKSKEQYNPNYLIGYYADVQDVDPSIYDDDALGEVDTLFTELLEKQGDFKKYGCYKPRIHFKKPKVYKAMFPFYFLAIRDKSNKKVYYAVVNGQTGDMMVDLPTSFPKYLLLSLIVSLIIYLIIFSSFIFNIKELCLALSALGLASMIISIKQANLIGKKFYHSDDEGYTSKNIEPAKIHTFKYYYKNLIAMILPILVLMSNTIVDYYYYVVAIITLILIVVSFKDLIKVHNLLVSNKLPQLNKRGGDESE